MEEKRGLTVAPSTCVDQALMEVDGNLEHELWKQALSGSNTLFEISARNQSFSSPRVLFVIAITVRGE